MELVLGALLGAVLSALTSIAITVWVERLRQPRLRLSIETPPTDAVYQNRPATFARYVRVWVVNEQPAGWVKWIMRQTALQCRAEITFHHLDGQNVFGRTMAGRWAGTPEPTAIPVVGPNGVEYQILDFVRLTTDSRIDIQPGDRTALDIAAKFDSEDVCYGWSNDAYFVSTPWRNPAWRLNPGRYLVRAVVICGGQRFRFQARLINDVSRTDFRLEDGVMS
jgi:hypothetical protein